MAWDSPRVRRSALARAPASAAATAAQCPASGKDRRRPLRSPDARATVTDRLAAEWSAGVSAAAEGGPRPAITNPIQRVTVGCLGP